MSAVSGMKEEHLSELRSTLAKRIGSRRFLHTLGVEEAIIALGECYLPGEIPRLRVAALLHDLTKEWSNEQQISFCAENEIPLTLAERATPKILHAKTGAKLAELEFFPYVDEGILNAICRHTTGASGMEIFDELLYLADYIEPTRTYPECVALREAFWNGYPASDDKLCHLHTVTLTALESTVKEIEGRGGTVLSDTEDAIRFLREITGIG